MCLCILRTISRENQRFSEDQFIKYAILWFRNQTQMYSHVVWEVLVCCDHWPLDGGVAY